MPLSVMQSKAPTALQLCAHRRVLAASFDRHSPPPTNREPHLLRVTFRSLPGPAET